MESNANLGREPEEQRPITMSALDEQTETYEDGTTPEDVDKPIPDDDDIEEGSLEDDEPEEDLDDSGTGTVTEELEEDEPNDEVDNLDSQYKTSPQRII